MLLTKSVALSISALLFFIATSHADDTYTEQATTIISFDGTPLKAMFTMPVTEPRGSVLILQGSGNVDLDGDVSSPFLGNGYKGQQAKLSQQLARTLAENGIASLRFSKRGVDDANQLINQTMPYLIKDAQTALNTLKAQFSETKTALLGLSEGALIATTLATTNHLDGLFLLGTPTRSIDDILAYQFLEWPVTLAKQAFDHNNDGTLDGSELGNAKLPLLGAGFGPADWTAIDANKNGALSITDELIPTYQNFYMMVMQIARTQLAPWYNSMRDMPAFSTLAAKVTAPAFLYQGLDDAQVKWSWAAADYSSFAGPKTFKVFANLGHCFSPMEGAYGETKTSGPIDTQVVTQLLADINSQLK